MVVDTPTEQRRERRTSRTSRAPSPERIEHCCGNDSGLTPWDRITLAPPRLISSPSGDPDIDGVIATELKPGPLYQVRLYHNPHLDPNIHTSKPEPPDATVAVVALSKTGKRTDLISSEDHNVGGTWYRQHVGTTVPIAFTLQVGEGPPFTDAQGLRRFLHPLLTAFRPLAPQHDVQVAPLLPGNPFQALVRVVDKHGNWQERVVPFHTHQRYDPVGDLMVHLRPRNDVEAASNDEITDLLHQLPL